MIRILTLCFVVAVCLAYDPHLHIAEKVAIPHHIRHNYEYADINLRDIRRGVNQNVQQGFSQLSGPQRDVRQSQPAQPSPAFQNQPFQSGPAFQRQSFEPSRGFQSSPQDQSREIRNSPGRNTRFFNLGPSRPDDFLTRRS